MHIDGGITADWATIAGTIDLELGQPAKSLDPNLFIIRLVSRDLYHRSIFSCPVKARVLRSDSMGEASMAKAWAGDDSLGASQHELDLILNAGYQDAFQAQDYFSLDGSTCHVFDVIEGSGIMRSHIGGDEVLKMIKVS